MADIKKFKNGKITITLDRKYDIDSDTNEVSEGIYHDDMFMEDLYFQTINVSIYLIDFNTSLVYEVGSYLMQNPLKWLLDTLQEDGKIHFYPLSKKESASLIEDFDSEEF